MGTDIHMACEVRNPKTKKWKTLVKEVFRNTFTGEPTAEPYSGRNYNLFAILADVRNGFGLHGKATGEEFEPISLPKGLPEDMDPKTEGFLSGDHSQSWVSLKELQDYDWTRKHKSCGYVTEDEYVKILRGEMPGSWCGGVGGPGIVILSESEMVEMIYGRKKRKPDEKYYTHAWFAAETYAECAGSFYTTTMKTLESLIPDGGTTEDVRLVFDFDS